MESIPYKAKEIWQTVLGELQLQVTRPYYETYLKNTVGLDFQGDKLTIGASTPFAGEWLRVRMRDRIEETISRIARRSIRVQVTVLSHDQGLKPAYPSLDLDENKDYGSRDEATEGLRNLRGNRAANLNSRFTFESFVVGDSNRMAHAAALSIFQKPNHHYNPIVIHSSTGLGKTHLLHAIGHAATAQNWSAIYVTAEEFTNDFVSSIREKSHQKFREKYRSVNLLLMDDIQFIEGKEQTQEGFYHTFNSLHDAGKQVVVASDTHPAEMEAMDRRLVSRFEGGLVANIQPPDLLTREAILKANALRQGITLPQEILELTAREVQGDIRQLEGAFNLVSAYAKASNSPITLELASEALDNIVRSKTRDVTPATIIDCTSNYFQVAPEEVRGRGRSKRLVIARHISMYLLKEHFNMLPVRIGALLGDRTPTAVAISCRKIQEGLEDNSQLRHHLSRIRDSIYSSSSIS